MAGWCAYRFIFQSEDMTVIEWEIPETGETTEDIQVSRELDRNETVRPSFHQFSTWVAETARKS